MAELTDVFGISRRLPLSYVAREAVDRRLSQNLSRSRHVLVTGGSKQGKTCLHRHCIADARRWLVQCRANMSSHQVYGQILKSAGFRVSGSGGVSLNGAPLARVVDPQTEQQMELDLEEPTDLVPLLRMRPYVVLEDVHYLSEAVQVKIALDLKTFHDISDLCFVVCGVWDENTKMVAQNTDLAGRMAVVNCDGWGRREMTSVIESGANLLNWKLSAEVKETLLVRARGNIGNLQEECFRLGYQLGLERTADEPVEVARID